ncbi:MAG: 4Fe-4S binding protein [Dehalococcoidia bacterium]|nr:4Fe-4S binding protein [Dehalococcoidia bacterium]
MPPVINEEKCNACGICADICPGDVLGMVECQPQVLYPDECAHCGACFLDCPQDAIRFHIPLPMILATSRGNLRRD